MAGVLHGSARTTPRVRAERQASKDSSRALAARYGLNPKTVAKWRARTVTSDAPMGPKTPASTILSPAEEAIVVEFRRRTLLPLDDILGCLRETIPSLSRSALHRCLQRHGISRLPAAETAQTRKRFKTYDIGYVHIDRCELCHADGTLIMFLAIDRVSKFTDVEFHDSAGKMEGSAFLRNVVAAFPYTIHTVLTDNVLRSEEGRLARQQVSVREHAPAVCLSSMSIQAAPADPEELSAIANTGSSRCMRHRGPHRPQHEMSIQAGDPSIIYRVVVLTPSRLC